MAYKPAKAISGGLLGGRCGALAGFAIGAAVEYTKTSSRVSPSIGIGPVDDVAGVFDACSGFFGVLLGAGVGAILGGVGGSVLGAGLGARASRRASSGRAGYAPVETPEEEVARLRQRLADLERDRGDAHRPDSPRDG